MKQKAIIIAALFFLILIMPLKASSEQTSDYLILQDIPPYKIDVPKQLFKSFDNPVGGPKSYSSSGILGATGHFPDHVDKTYEVMYLGGGTYPAPTVQVTQHPGSDSDKWLLHEVEDGYRNSEDKDEGLGRFYGKLREINGQKVIYSGLGGGNFTWVSNKIVINIEYTDLYRQKPEPLEVVQAYLQKFPSSIPTTQVADRSHDELWLKDEMERRLWLSEKWFNQLDLQKAEITAGLKEVVKHLDVFLKYREKYYSVAAKSEQQILQNYLNQNNTAMLKEKLKEYQIWWSQHKGEAINL